MNIPHTRDTKFMGAGVFRKTELHGTAPAATAEEREKERRKTLKGLRDPGCEIDYTIFDKTFRNLICSIIERQNRIRDENLLHVADLQQQVDALERRLAESEKVHGNKPEMHP